jgi:hypothetical protein
MTTQIERETPEPQEEPVEPEREEELEPTYDGGYARLGLPGVEPTEEKPS